MSICHRSGEINGLLVCERRFKKDPQGLPGSSGGGGCYKLKIIWLADCSSAPQMHLGVSSMPHRYRHVPKWPTPVLSLFSAAHRLRGSSEPDERQTARVTRNLAGGVALSHAALHDSRRLKFMSKFMSAAAWRRKGRHECMSCVPRNCALWTRVWRGWLMFSCAQSARLKVKYSLRRWTGGMPENTGESSLRVSFRHPEASPET